MRLLGPLGALLRVSGWGAGATPQTSRLLAEGGHLPQRAEVAGVPFYPQERYYCGPAALAMVMTWSGDPVTPDALVPEVYTPSRQGTLRNDMVAAARRRGRLGACPRRRSGASRTSPRGRQRLPGDPLSLARQLPRVDGPGEHALCAKGLLWSRASLPRGDTASAEGASGLEQPRLRLGCRGPTRRSPASGRRGRAARSRGHAHLSRYPARYLPLDPVNVVLP